MQDARDVVAVVDANKLPAERVAVAVLDEDLLADDLGRRVEIHGEEFAEEREARQRHALRRRRFRRLDRRRILDDLLGVVERLLRIPELSPADLRRAFDRDERPLLVLDREDAAYGLRLVAMTRATPDGPVHADDRDVALQHDSAVDRV